MYLVVTHKKMQMTLHISSWTTLTKYSIAKLSFSIIHAQK